MERVYQGIDARSFVAVIVGDKDIGTRHATVVRFCHKFYCSCVESWGGLPGQQPQKRSAHPISGVTALRGRLPPGEGEAAKQLTTQCQHRAHSEGGRQEISMKRSAAQQTSQVRRRQTDEGDRTAKGGCASTDPAHGEKEARTTFAGRNTEGDGIVFAEQPGIERGMAAQTIAEG